MAGRIAGERRRAPPGVCGHPDGAWPANSTAPSGVRFRSLLSRLAEPGQPRPRTNLPRNGSIVARMRARRVFMRDVSRTRSAQALSYAARTSGSSGFASRSKLESSDARDRIGASWSTMRRMREGGSSPRPRGLDPGTEAGSSRPASSPRMLSTSTPPSPRRSGGSAGGSRRTADPTSGPAADPGGSPSGTRDPCMPVSCHPSAGRRSAGDDPCMSRGSGEPVNGPFA